MKSEEFATALVMPSEHAAPSCFSSVFSCKEKKIIMLKMSDDASNVVR